MSRFNYGALALRSEDISDITKTEYISWNIYIISCNLKQQAHSYRAIRSTTPGESLSQISKVYIKVHNPETCMCLAKTKLDVHIQQPYCAGEQDEHNLAHPGANVFNSLYFRRKDGTLRNALGGVITEEVTKGDREATAYGKKQIVRSKDLVVMVGTGGAGETRGADEKFTKKLDWAAGIIGR